MANLSGNGQSPHVSSSTHTKKYESKKKKGYSMKRWIFLQPTREEGSQASSLLEQKENARARKASRPSQLVLLGITLLIVTGCLSFLLLHQNETKAAALLPGQQIWSQGTSSFLYGANDASWQWSQENMGNTPAIAAAVRTAGITVIRTPLHIGDAQARVAVVKAAGAQCLGILSEADAQQVVRQLGDSCNMYEWQNEPDNAGISAIDYATSWNQNIPVLRSINPHAIFIGPVVASPNIGYIQQFLTIVKQKGNIPNVVSYHMYPCTDAAIAGCPAHIADFVTAANQVRAAVRSVIGTDIPLGVTEWNYSWKANQTPQNDPYMASFTQQSLQAMAQAGVTIANQFDIGSGGSLDMVHIQTGASTPQLQAMQQMIAQVRGTTLPATVTISPTGTPPSSTATPSATNGSSSNPPLVLGQQLACPARNIVQPQGTPVTQPVVSPTVSGTATAPPITSTPSSPTTGGTSPIPPGCSLQQQLPAGQYLLVWWPLDPTTATTSMTLVLPSGSYQVNEAGGTQEISIATAGSMHVSLVAPGTGTLTENITLCQLTGMGTQTTGTPTVLPSSPVLNAA